MELLQVYINFLSSHYIYYLVGHFYESLKVKRNFFFLLAATTSENRARKIWRIN